MSTFSIMPQEAKITWNDYGVNAADGEKVMYTVVTDIKNNVSKFVDLPEFRRFIIYVANCLDFIISTKFVYPCLSIPLSCSFNKWTLEILNSDCSLMRVIIVL